MSNLVHVLALVGFVNSIALSAYILVSSKYVSSPNMRILGVFLLLLSVKFSYVWGLPFFEDISHPYAVFYTKLVAACFFALGPCALLLWRTTRFPSFEVKSWHYLLFLPSLLILATPREMHLDLNFFLWIRLVLIGFLSFIAYEFVKGRHKISRETFHLVFALLFLVLAIAFSVVSKRRFEVGSLFALAIYLFVFFVLTNNEPATRRRGQKKVPVQSGLKEKIIALFTEQRVYRNEDISLPKLSEMLGEPLHDVSRVINQEMGISFHDLVNQYRIKDATEYLMKESSDDRILSIAIECGFKSLTTFNRAFKKHTNTTPSQFRRHNARVQRRVMTTLGGSSPAIHGFESSGSQQTAESNPGQVL